MKLTLLSSNKMKRQNISQENDLNKKSKLSVQPSSNDATRASSLINSGLAKFDQKDYTSAIADFDQALAINPKDTFALRTRGAAKQRQGDYAELFEAIKKSSDIEFFETAYNKHLDNTNRNISKPNKDLQELKQQFASNIHIKVQAQMQKVLNNTKSNAL